MQSSLLTILLCVPLLVFGQSWCPPGAHWSYSLSTFGGGGFAHYMYEKDTVIDGTNCKKLLGYSEIQSTVPGPPFAQFTYESNDTVFFFLDGIFKPVYYFNAALGDTIEVPLLNQPCGDMLKIVVDSVSTLQVQGHNLRYYRATYDDSTTSPTSIHVVERFGTINEGMIPKAFCEGFGSTFMQTLGCYQDNTISEYQVTPGITCEYYFPTGIAENAALAASITLLPNPATASLSINTGNNSIKQYEVVNIEGRVLITGTLETRNILIDVSAFPTGIYLVKLQLQDGQYILKRFVKE